MPLLQNAKKALRSSRRKAIFNSRTKSLMKTMIDRMISTPTEENLATAYSSIDIAVKNNLLHKNKAGRLKGQLSKLSLRGTKAPKKAVVKKASAKKVVKKTTK